MSELVENPKDDLPTVSSSGHWSDLRPAMETASGVNKLAPSSHFRRRVDSEPSNEPNQGLWMLPRSSTALRAALESWYCSVVTKMARSVVGGCV